MEKSIAPQLFLWLLASVVIGGGLVGPLFAQEGTVPPPAKHAIGPQNQLQLHPEDQCPVCAMRPAKYHKFATAIALTDGRTYYFCSAGCMIRAWLHPKAFLKAAPETRLRPVVQTYFNGRSMDGRQVTWVAASDVMGPMGPAIVALESPEMANAFRERHGGKHQFQLDEMTDALWEKIRGKKALW